MLGKLAIRSHCVQRQSIGNLDCGIYAAVNIWLLLSHVAPGKYQLNEKTLRHKILESFLSNNWKVETTRLKKPRGRYCIYRM